LEVARADPVTSINTICIDHARKFHIPVPKYELISTKELFCISIPMTKIINDRIIAKIKASGK